MEDEFMRSEEVARKIGVTGQTVRALVRAGRLPAIVIESGTGRRTVRFRRSEVERWIGERLVGQR